MIISLQMCIQKLLAIILWAMKSYPLIKIRHLSTKGRNIETLNHFSTENLQELNIGLTSRCNASCPMCRRNPNGGPVLADLPMSELSFEDVVRLAPPEFLRGLSRIVVAGDFGENTLAKDFVRIVNYFSSSSRAFISVDTNGGTRSEDWWFELGKVSRANKVMFCFAIDGLKDTNHIYRKGVSWDKLMSNCKAFIKGGGIARWGFIPFKHNEFQVSDAITLSKNMGFHSFEIRRTNRFRGQNSFPVKDKNNTVIYEINPAESPKYTHKKSSAFPSNSIPSYLAEAKIECKALRRQQVIISFNGMVFPCCFFSSTFWGKHIFSEQWKQLLQEFGGPEHLKKGIKETLHGGFFKAIASRWGELTPATERLSICALFCGDKSPQLEKSVLVHAPPGGGGGRN